MEEMDKREPTEFVLRCEKPFTFVYRLLRFKRHDCNQIIILS